VGRSRRDSTIVAHVGYKCLAIPASIPLVALFPLRNQDFGGWLCRHGVRSVAVSLLGHHAPSIRLSDRDFITLSLECPVSS
jgi:hypothetical protein